MALLPPHEPHNAKPGKGSKKNLHKRETWEERATSKSKPQIALLMMKPNTSEGAKPLPLVACQELEDETPKVPVPKVPLPIKMVLKEGPYANDQATVTPLVRMMILKYLTMSKLRSSISS